MVDEDKMKEALKEALKEWLDEKATQFGWFSIKAIGALMLAALVWGFISTKGFKLW
jgi:hypothetical protein